MKRSCILELLLFCLILSACGADATQVIEIPGIAQPTIHLGTDATLNDSTLPTTQPDVVPSTTPPTEATTSKPTTGVNGPVTYRDVKPYSLPVANPDKPIYATPDGSYRTTFGTIGYYTIVEEATDAEGRTWGRLSNDEGWTLVYFDVLPELDLWFGSGVGAWGTDLSITGKGAFSGQAHDSNAGEMDDAYPNGTCYICDFSGSFAITAIDTYTISLKMTALKSENKDGDEWIEDGVLYIATSAYGLEGESEFVLYTPDTPVEALPEDAYAWSPPEFDGDTIGCYALYALKEGYTFFGE